MQLMAGREEEENLRRSLVALLEVKGETKPHNKPTYRDVVSYLAQNDEELDEQQLRKRKVR